MLTLTNREASLDPVEVGRAADILLYAVVGLIAAAIAWAAIAEVDQTSRAPGRVRTDLETQVVSNLEGGTVAEVLVRPGQVVKKGQPLLRLDSRDAYAEFGGSSAQVAGLRAKVDRLTAETGGAAPSWSSTGAEASVQRSLYASRGAELAGTLAADRARIAEASHAVDEARATLATRRAAADSARSRLAMVEPLVAKGIEPRTSLMEAQRDLSVSTGEVSAAAAALTRAQASVSEAQASLTRDRGQWQVQAADELAAARTELETRSRGLPALQGRMDRTIVRAPRSGRVDRLLVATVGAAVRPGEPIAEIVPDDDVLIVEAKVRPQDIGHVAPGQSASVAITAYDSAVYGSLSGTVASISPDAQVDQRTGESAYLVRVRVPHAGLVDRNGKALRIGAGMVANVSLLGDKRSVLSYLLTPITRLSETALRD